MNNYKKLMKLITEITDIEYGINLINWELRISGAFDSKDYLIDVISRLEEKYYELITSDEYGKLLNCIINENDNIDKLEMIKLKKLYEKYNKYKKIPSDFYIEYNKKLLISTKVWEEAKSKNNYELFKPYLKKNIEMTKKYYQYIGNFNNLYDSMLNEYEIGINTNILDSLFNKLKEYLIPLIKKIKKNKIEIENNYTNEEIKYISNYLLYYIGFDLSKGSIGIFPHGFTTRINKNDIRIAIENSKHPLSFVKTIIHEGGHGLFEQNICDKLAKYSNNCIEDMFALHESQSRFYENILSRNKNFWIPIFNDIKKLLKIDINLDQFIDNYNIVTPSLVRTEADEITYAMHIIIRYEIEKDIFNNNLSVDDIPSMWNRKMKEYLGIEPVDDKDGVMQDIHWAECAFGYFPTYLLGNIYDGMLVEFIEEKLGSIDKILQNGDIKKITNFLINNIYSNGNSYSFRELIGKDLSVEPLIKFYENRYNNK